VHTSAHREQLLVVVGLGLVLGLGFGLGWVFGDY